jgi:WD40 repeat protein
LEELKGHTDSVRCVAFSPDGTKIASGSDDGSVRISDVAARRQLRELKGHIGSV